MTKEQAFKTELAALLEKYEAKIYIEWVCAEYGSGYHSYIRASGKGFKIYSEASLWKPENLK